MKILQHYIKSHLKNILFFSVCLGILLFLIFLYEIPWEVAGYMMLLIGVFAFIWSVVQYYFYCRRYRELVHLEQEVKVSLSHLPQPETLMEEEYQKLLGIVFEDKTRQLSNMDRQKEEMMDYFTMWVHQIKTPIAGMSLLLQTENTEEAKELQGELFRIEQYVQMVLTYLRLTSETNDFVIKEQELDPILKTSIRKYASQFIRRKLSMNFTESNAKVLVDAKWLGFVIEQVLSNALKYTNQGGVSIDYRDGSLNIKDTGIGIAPEDIPRIFEKGYTGYNGRIHDKSSGIGLYLCKKTMDKMGGHIEVISEIGKGTMIRLYLPVQDRKYE